MTEFTPKVILKTDRGYEVYSDSYMLTMSKKELIGIIRCLEHNWANEVLVAERQYNLLMKNKDNINFDI